MSAQTKSETSRTYFLAEADCQDNSGAPVVRYLGTYQGMSDNGCPAWTAWGSPTQFASFEAAWSAVAHPWALSSHDSHYRGGEIRISQVKKTVRTWTSVETKITKMNEATVSIKVG